MKRTRCFITILLLSVLVFSVQGSVIKVLAVGNSFSENAIEQNLYQLAETNGDTLIIGNMFIPECTINRHWKCAQSEEAAYQYRKVVNGKKENTSDKSMLECVRDEAWDYISFQQGSYDSGNYATYTNLPLLMKFVAENVINIKVKYIFHATWAYAQDTKHSGFKNYNSNQMCMYNAIIEVVDKIVKEINEDKSNPNKIALVVPSGTAIQNGRASSLGDIFCGSDGYHLNALGKYTAACTWLEMITGKTPVGNSYKPSDITIQQAKIAQQAAHNAVLYPDRVTSW